MKRGFLVLCLILSMCVPCLAQVPITAQWDKSADDDRNPSNPNPVKYAVYICADSAMTNCAKIDAGTSLTLTHNFSAGSYWIYVTARWMAYVIDGVPSGPEQESGKSNVIAFKLVVPPGNPANAKIRLQTP